MIDGKSMKIPNSLKSANPFGLVFLAFLMIALAGCFSSTKVYQTDKTIQYDGALYNMSNVQKIGATVEGKLPNGEVKNMRGMSKKDVEALLKQSSPIQVVTAIDMDDRQLIYERRNITKYSEFSSMVKKFESAGKKVSKFMADKKATQLKLK